MEPFCPPCSQVQPQVMRTSVLPIVNPIVTPYSSSSPSFSPTPQQQIRNNGNIPPLPVIGSPVPVRTCKRKVITREPATIITTKTVEEACPLMGVAQPLLGMTNKACAYPVLIFLIIVIIGLIINLILLATRVIPITTASASTAAGFKSGAAFVGSVFTILIALIFAAFFYYICIHYKLSGGWGIYLSAIILAILITFFAAWLMGYYIGIGSLWWS